MRRAACPPPRHELGHDRLVHGRVGVSHAGADAPPGLGQEAHRVGPSALCPVGNGGGGLRRLRAVDDAGRDPRRVRCGVAVGACAGLGDRGVARRLRAALSAGGAVVAGLGGLRHQDAGSVAQLRPGTEPELPRDFCAATPSASRGDRLLGRGREQPLEAGRSTELAVPPAVRRGRLACGLAQGRPAAGAPRGRQHGVLRARRNARVRAGVGGNRPCASHGELALPGPGRGDGLPAERRRAPRREAFR